MYYKKLILFYSTMFLYTIATPLFSLVLTQLQLLPYSNKFLKNMIQLFKRSLVVITLNNTKIYISEWVNINKMCHKLHQLRGIFFKNCKNTKPM